MDSISDYIWLAVVIISFIASMFTDKKKKKGKKPRSNSPTTQRQGYKIPDPFDLEDAIKVPEKKQRPIEQKKKRIETEYVPVERDTNEVLRQRKLQNEAEKLKRSKSSVSDGQKSEAEKIMEKPLKVEKTSSGKLSRASIIRKNIRNSDTLKEYIIFQELINKPKALRDT